jgi:hypothetical protein
LPKRALYLSLLSIIAWMKLPSCLIPVCLLKALRADFYFGSAASCHTDWDVPLGKSHISIIFKSCSVLFIQGWISL